MIRKYYLNLDIYHAILDVLSKLVPSHLSLLSRLGNIVIVWQDLDPNYLLGTSSAL